VEILNVVDDHSRLLVASRTFETTKAGMSSSPSTKRLNSTGSRRRC
jgi:hypothetical protein